jgi:hypothetical protein
MTKSAIFFAGMLPGFCASVTTCVNHSCRRGDVHSERRPRDTALPKTCHRRLKPASDGAAFTNPRALSAYPCNPDARVDLTGAECRAWFFLSERVMRAEVFSLTRWRFSRQVESGREGVRSHDCAPGFFSFPQSDAADYRVYRGKI